jgi:hypothetical protein
VAARAAEELRRRASTRQRRRSCGGAAAGSRWKAVVRCGCEGGRQHVAGENTTAWRSSGLGHGGGTVEQRARARRRQIEKEGGKTDRDERLKGADPLSKR